MPERNTVIAQTREQADPSLCDPRDWEVIEEGQPFHGQCGKDEREYNRLLAEGAKKANASASAEIGEVHPNVNRAGKPHTP